MNTNRILLAGLVGGVFAFFFGWLLWGILFNDLMPTGIKAVERAESDMIMWALAVANLLWGILIAYIFVQWANISTWQSGAIAGAVIGFFTTASFDLGYFAMTNLFTLQELAIDVALNTLWVATIGAVVGWWLGWKK